MCLTANEQNVQAVNQAPLCFATMETTPVYYLFFQIEVLRYHKVSSSRSSRGGGVGGVESGIGANVINN